MSATRCTTHFHACDCREAKFAALEAENGRLRDRAVGEHNASGTLWRHIKSGGFYRLLGSCRIEATNQPAFAYRGMLDETIWVRPMDEFLDGRFEKIEGSDPTHD